MIRSFLSLAVSAVALLALNQATPAQEKEKPKLVISQEAQQIIKLTNDTRVSKQAQPIIDLTNNTKNAKLKPLKANALLFKCAQAHSENMARQMKAAHDLNGKNPSDRVLDIGYDYLTCGENVAEAPNAQFGIPAVFTGWMNSPIHRREILRIEYEEIGIGIARDVKGKLYYTQVFGTVMKKEGKEILALTNGVRLNEKLKQLDSSSLLFMSAQNHAENMAKQEKADDVLDKKSSAERVKDVGYAFKVCRGTVGHSPENKSTIAEMVQGWIEDQATRREFLNDAVTEMGIGFAKDKDGNGYYSIVFATPLKKN